jgi:transposase
VLNDIAAYWSKLVSGGIMSFHDHENESYGVKKAVAEFAKENNLEVHLLPENKPEDAGAWIQKP